MSLCDSTYFSAKADISLTEQLTRGQQAITWINVNQVPWYQSKEWSIGLNIVCNSLQQPPTHDQVPIT